MVQLSFPWSPLETNSYTEASGKPEAFVFLGMLYLLMAYKDKGKAWREAHPDYHRNYDRKNRLPQGWTSILYEAVNTAQDEKCAICKRPNVSGRRLSADHDHRNGQPRGLLCSPCNSALGLFQDDPAILDSAAQYLRKYLK